MSQVLTVSQLSTRGQQVFENELFDVFTKLTLRVWTESASEALKQRKPDTVWVHLGDL